MPLLVAGTLTSLGQWRLTSRDSGGTILASDWSILLILSSHWFRSKQEIRRYFEQIGETRLRWEDFDFNPFGSKGQHELLQSLRQETASINEKKEEIEVKPDIIEVEIGAPQCSEPNTSNNLTVNEPEVEEPTENQNDVVTNFVDLQNNIKELMNGTTCKVCGKEFITKTALFSHVESHIEGLNFTCNLCHKQYSSSNALRVHNYRCPVQKNKGQDELPQGQDSETAVERKEELTENVDALPNIMEESPDNFEETKADLVLECEIIHDQNIYL